jgi:hypothetical protein
MPLVNGKPRSISAATRAAPHGTVAAGEPDGCIEAADAAGLPDEAGVAVGAAVVG